jgi:hypothetical protein
MLHGFVDSNWAKDASDRKSTLGCCFNLGSRVFPGSVALSSAKDKYMAASTTSYEAIWLRTLIEELTGEMLKPTMVYCDN